MILRDVAPSTLLIGLVPVLLVLSLIAFWVWMFKEMLNNDDLLVLYRPDWITAFILLNIPAAVFYYLTVYRNR